MAILRTNGFVQLRRGLMEHVMNGSMTATQAFVYIAILTNADPGSGIWYGSAGVLSAVFSLPQRTCREAMERLEKAGYIKRFAVQGRHGSYPIFVHRFECSDGAAKGMRLNAIDSVSYTTPIYISRHEDVSDDGNEHGNDDGNETAGKYLDNKRKDNKRKKPSRDKRESDPRHHEFHVILAAYWEYANPGDEMPWDGSEAGQLSALLGAVPKLGAEQFKICLNNRHKSDGINTSRRPCEWIRGITDYSKSALNQFNQPKTGATNGHASKGDERERAIKQTINRAVSEMGGEEIGEDDGVLPADLTRR